MKVRDAMHEHADWVEHDTPIAEVARLMREADIGAVPVGKDDRLIGMVTDRDIALRLVADAKDAKKTTASQIMTPGVIFCTTQEDVEDAIHLMDQKKIRRLPVLNDARRLVGMLSLGDISHSAGRELSGELLRAVSEHHSTHQPAVREERKTQPTVVQD